jgi:tetratricopeptide (TPR) repeat protein
MAGSKAKQLAYVLRGAPVTIPALLALALFVSWAGNQAGYPVTHWAPGGLIVLGLLAIALASVPLRVREIPLAVKIVCGCLALYTLLSFLSILWAAVPGDAWEGADRTLLYLLVFALFALWPQRGLSAAGLLGAWTLAMIALAVFVVLHIDTRAGLVGGFSNEGRLLYPAGYENASAATWAMAMWPALLLARSEHIPWGLRGVLAGGMVVLGDLALLSLSRGSLYATAVMLVLVFVLFTGRVRTFALLVPVAAGIGITATEILRVGDRVQSGRGALAAMHSATAAIFASAIVVGLAVALGAAIESGHAFSEVSKRRVHRCVAALALAALAVLLIGGWVAAGNPVTRIRHGWDTFKGGYAANSSTGNRLVSGLGSDRYDFYRVALHEFEAHPLVGIGVDNFQQQYLKHGRGEETPRYPHSVELRTLTETGLLGALLALLGLGAALLACARVARSARERGSDPLAPIVATAALGGFAYWVVHGSVDWFWEFAGLGAPAFALLGLACALVPRKRGEAQIGAPAPRRAATRRGPRALLLLTATLGAALAAVSLAAPWLSQLEIQSAARIWPHAPLRAYAGLDDAAQLNPLSDEAYLVAGSIALRFGDLTRADHEFELALGRVPGDAYATLERGAIASMRGNRASALSLLERAERLNPRDRLTGEALLLVRKGKRLSVEALNRSILLKAQQLS